MKPIVVWLGAMVVGICFAVTVTAVAQESPAVAEPKVGDRSASGRLIIHVFHQIHSDQALPAELQAEYGCIILNTGVEKPKALYRLAAQKMGTIEEFEDLKLFQAALAKLPKGAVLTVHDQCLVPAWDGLNFDWRAFRQTCKRFGIRLRENANSICTCPD